MSDFERDGFPHRAGDIVIYRYGDRYKVLQYKTVGHQGVRLPRERECGAEGGRLDNNVSRARGRVFELALCNNWEYFVTLTIDKAKFERFDLEAYQKAFSKWLRNRARCHGVVRYVLIPEQHKDGAWHMHGLMTGLCVDKDLSYNEHGFLDWPAYREKFGYISLSPVRDRQRVASYITKYVTKAMAETVLQAGKHLFYASKGLAGKERQGSYYRLRGRSELQWEYSGDYNNILWCESRSELETLLQNFFEKNEFTIFGL